MAVKFRKRIARPGVVMPKNPLGRRVVKTITKEYLSEVEKEGNQAIADGLLIPAPYGHTDKDGTYPIPLLRTTEGELVDAKSGKSNRWDHAINAGFWTGFETDQEGALWGVLEAEGDENDENTHAGRIGKTFKQVSPFITDWLDGSGKFRKNIPLHICVTNRAVQNGQDNFELLKSSEDGKATRVPDQERIARQGISSPELAIAMSFGDEDYTDATLELSQDTDLGGSISSIVNTNISPEMVGKIKALLKEKLNVILPDDTDTDNFSDRIYTVLHNMQPMEGEGFDQPPTGSEVRSPIIMDLSNPDVKSLHDKNSVLLQNATAAKKDSAKQRINNLVQSGRVGRKFADEKLIPMADSLVLSLDDITDDGIATTPLELSLDTLEATDALIETDPNKKLHNAEEIPGYVPDEPDDMGDDRESAEATEDEVNAVLDNALPMSRRR